MKFSMDIEALKAFHILGLDRGASQSQIHERYRSLALQHHPERAGRDPDRLQFFQQVSLAFNTLCADEEGELHNLNDMMGLFERATLTASYIRDEERCSDESSEEDEAPSSVDTFASQEQITNSEDERERRTARRRDKKKRRREKKRLEKLQGSQNSSASDPGTANNSELLVDPSVHTITRSTAPPVLPVRSNCLVSNGASRVHPHYELSVGDSSATDSLHICSLSKKDVGVIGQKPSNVRIPAAAFSESSAYLLDSDQHQLGTSNSMLRTSNCVLGTNDSIQKTSDLWVGSSSSLLGTSNSLLRTSSSLVGTSGPLLGTRTVQSAAAVTGSVRATTQQNGETLPEAVAEARKWAIEGNKHAGSGDLHQAVLCFSRAVHLDPQDHRFYGNRSYCYDKMGDYESALQDADHAISLMPSWPKAYFRRGRALAGIQASRPRGEKDYDQVEAAFLRVLQLDSECEDALSELHHVRTQALMDMGFSEPVARAATLQHGSKELALDALLSANSSVHLAVQSAVHSSVQSAVHSDEVYQSDEEGSQQASLQRPAAAKTKKQPLIVCREPNKSASSKGPGYERKLDHSNPDGLKALWVGNIQPSVTEKDIKRLFSKYGELTLVRMMPEKFCAFINFTNPEAAGKAMEKLQGHPIGGQTLLIKFPDNPIKMSMTRPIASSSSDAPSPSKARAPSVEGECHFWRTTGCQYGSKCNFLHVPANKGVDKQSWHKK